MGEASTWGEPWLIRLSLPTFNLIPRQVNPGKLPVVSERVLCGIKINVPLPVGEEEPPNSFFQEESVDDHTEPFLHGQRWSAQPCASTSCSSWSTLKLQVKLRETGAVEATDPYTMLEIGYPNHSSPRYLGFKIITEGSCCDRHSLWMPVIIWLASPGP